MVAVASGVDGHVQNRYEYDIFGMEILNGVEEVENSIRYAGEFYDASAGLYYLRARYYDPATARFISEDTYRGDATDPASLNLYAYCGNDPINYTDPTGHWYVPGVDPGVTDQTLAMPDIDEPLPYFGPDPWEYNPGYYTPWYGGGSSGGYATLPNWISGSGSGYTTLPNWDGSDSGYTTMPNWTDEINISMASQYTEEIKMSGESLATFATMSTTFIYENATAADIRAALENGDYKAAEKMLMNMPEAERNTFIQDYVNNAGGINQNMPKDSNGNSLIYQGLYGAGDGPPYDKPPWEADRQPKPTGQPDGEEGQNVNRYDDYEFTIWDALNWMIQTGGDINFFMQVRDLQNLEDSAGNFDSWLAKEKAAEWQANVIGLFDTAKGFLDSAGFANDVRMPSFYIGAVELHPETLLDWDGTAGIYDRVVGKLAARGIGSSMIAGAYFGEDFNYIENPDVRGVVEAVSGLMHGQGKKLISSPYFSLDKQQQFMDNMEQIASDGFFDLILIQPGTYYSRDKQSTEDDPTKSARILDGVVSTINTLNGKGYSTKFGLQFEFDMGLVTGRDDPNMTVNADVKRERLNEYLRAITQLNPGTAIGIYSGGINEQGYRNPHKSTGRHNTGNHRVQDSWQRWTDGNGKPYSDSDWPMPYDGNLIYDINDYLFGRTDKRPI